MMAGGAQVSSNIINLCVTVKLENLAWENI